MRKLATLAFFVLAAGQAVHAADIRGISALSQPEFRLLTQDLSAAGVYKGLAPANALGPSGLDVAFTIGFTQLDSPTIWRKASFGRGIFTETVRPTLRVTKGLPFGLDVGFTYGGLDNAAASVAGVVLRWSAVQEGPVMPAVGLRLATTRVGSIPQLRLTNTSYDLVVSKRFGAVTPYLSVGQVETEASPSGAGALQRDSFSQRRVAVGGQARFGAFDLTLEGDLTGKTRTGSGRVGYRF